MQYTLDQLIKFTSEEARYHEAQGARECAPVIAQNQHQTKALYMRGITAELERLRASDKRSAA